MATKEEIEIAVKVVNEFAGYPESGAIAEIIKEMQKSEFKTDNIAAKEVRIVEAKETR